MFMWLVFWLLNVYRLRFSDYLYLLTLASSLKSFHDICCASNKVSFTETEMLSSFGGCIGSCQRDNFWYSQLRKFCQNDNITVSMLDHGSLIDGSSLCVHWPLSITASCPMYVAILEPILLTEISETASEITAWKSNYIYVHLAIKYNY